MSVEDDPLWQRLRAFTIDEEATGSTFRAAMITKGVLPSGFAERLADAQGWSVPYAAEVVDEYKRFLYLAVRADHPVVPPAPIDAAWRLHMSDTRSYWDQLCGEVLQCHLDHFSTSGGANGTLAGEAPYTRTLESYRAHFGEPPPPHIWPSFWGRIVLAARFLWSGIGAPRELIVAGLASAVVFVIAAIVNWDIEEGGWMGLIAGIAVGLVLLSERVKSGGGGFGDGDGDGDGGGDGGGGSGG